MTEVRAVEGLVRDNEHRYFYRGQRVPGVTEVISDLKLADYSRVSPRHQDLGSVLHACCALIAEGRLDWATVDPAIEPEAREFEAWFDRICEHGRLKPLVIEGMMYEPDRQFAGQTDLGLAFTEEGDARIIVVDVKRGAADKTVRLQLAGYGLLCARTYSIPLPLIDRYALHKFSEGRPPKMVQFENPSDYDAFLSALSLRNWMVSL